MSSDSGAELLSSLYEEELRNKPDWYLEAHAAPNAIRRVTDAADRYLPHIPSEGVILDWGCHHAPDACLVRNAVGHKAVLHGCDFAAEGQFPAFHDFAGLEYKHLSSPFELPYGDGTFDVVIGGGVLEHTANDSISLTELHRVLKEQGLLILAFLPNRFSYTEFLGRRMGSGTTHLRRYSRSAARRLLLHHGFLPIDSGYHQMIPAQSMPGFFTRFWGLNTFLERAWPLNRMATNLIFVSHRRSTM